MRVMLRLHDQQHLLQPAGCSRQPRANAEGKIMFHVRINFLRTSCSAALSLGGSARMVVIYVLAAAAGSVAATASFYGLAGAQPLKLLSSMDILV